MSKRNRYHVDKDEPNFEAFCPKCGERRNDLDYCSCGRKQKGELKMVPDPIDLVDGLNRSFHMRLTAIMSYCHDDSDLLGDTFEGGQGE